MINQLIKKVNSAVHHVHLINIIRKVNKLIKEVNNYIKSTYSNK